MASIHVHVSTCFIVITDLKKCMCNSPRVYYLIYSLHLKCNIICFLQVPWHQNKIPVPNPLTT